MAPDRSRFPLPTSRVRRKTILVDGVDPFADTDPAVPSMACRLYRTDEGVQGAPGVEALVRVLQR